MTPRALDPVRPGRRLLLFARIPLALGVALGIAQISGVFAGRDAALLGAPGSASPAPWGIALVVVLAVALLPGSSILLHGVERGLLFGIVGLVLYVLVALATARQSGIVLPVLAPAGAWYLSQVLGIGWRPHSEQDVRHFLPAELRRVFLSYRRSLDEVTARMLKHELAARGFDVFLDVDDLGPSPSFDRRLLEEIAARFNYVLLLSPGSLDRCHETGDWLRLEIEQALATGRRIVPVTRSGFELGTAPTLPPSLGSLPMHNAVEYASAHHAAVVDRLVSFLSRPRDAVAAGGR